MFRIITTVFVLDNVTYRHERRAGGKRGARIRARRRSRRRLRRTKRGPALGQGALDVDEREVAATPDTLPSSDGAVCVAAEREVRVESGAVGRSVSGRVAARPWRWRRRSFGDDSHTAAAGPRPLRRSPGPRTRPTAIAVPALSPN
ncbi:unnamed protein product [Arctia plantaginis]|uniref:Uncharacterized protein n=1 Tax=Arctia plantaginis TaxID=874455 RepID=A0A8S1BC61_ARCPL|nr:unnamed protein product [Arctia plantaginis]